MVRANQAPYMTKVLCKAIMRRLDSEIKHFQLNTKPIKNRKNTAADITRKKEKFL